MTSPSLDSIIIVYIYIHSCYDEIIQRRQIAQYRKRRAITFKVTLTSARCDTVFHIRRWRRWSSDSCRRRLGSAFISFDVGTIDVGGLTWRKVDATNLRFNCVDGFAWLSNISTFSSRHNLYNPDRRWQVVGRLKQFFPRYGVLDLLISMLPYILCQIGFVFVAFSFERLKTKDLD